MSPQLLLEISHFPYLWYIKTPIWWFRFFKRLLIFLDNELAVGLMARFWLVPVWQDTTIIGRSLSLIFRTTRVFLGAIIILAVFLAMLFWLIVWLALPLFLLLKAPYAVPIFAGVWLIDAVAEILVRQRDPTRLILEKAAGSPSRLRELLLSDPKSTTILELIEKDTRELPPNPPQLSLDEIIQNAKSFIKKDQKLKVEHLFLSLLSSLNYHQDQAQRAQSWLDKKQAWAHHPWIWEDDYPLRPIGGVNRGWTGITTPLLDRVSTDLTQMAARGKLPELIGRQDKIAEIVRILGREGKENVILVGEPGSGKTTLVEGLAYEIIRGTEYEGLRFKRLIALDIAAATSGSLAKVKERLVAIIEEIRAAGNVILFVDEIHNLVAAQEGETAAVFAALEPHLDAGEFQFVATTTPQNDKRYIEGSEAFARTFRRIDLPEATPEEAGQILEWKAFELERDHKVSLSYVAIEEAVELSRRYIHDRVLPDSAIDLLQESVDKAKVGKGKVTSKEVEEMVTEKTKIPVRAAESQKEKTLLLNLEKSLHGRVVGQDEAVMGLADSLRRARVGLAEEGRLLASFLFAGPTGVGKTETAKALAQVYFGSEKAMTRLDLSEFQTEDSLNRLIGPPPGMPGFKEGGQLTEAVRRRPFTVILLDEIEKANPKILDVFLQLLDDARLTDGTGRTVDFSNTILIATSNVGTKTLVADVKKGKPFSQLRLEVLDNLRRHFRPEFLNRFTGIVVYQPLTREQVKEIANLLLNRLKKTLAAKEIKLNFSDELVEELALKGYSPIWGARELRRIISDLVEEKLARMILEGKIKPGQTYTITSEMISQ